MSDWWSALDFPRQFFYAVGILAGSVLLIQSALTLAGAGHHDLPDLSPDHADGLGVLSQRTITGFFFGFGWTGVIALKNGWGLPQAILAACAVGAVFLFGIWSLMRALYGMRASGTLDYRNAVGQTGTVYVTVPAGMAPGGQVEVMVQGRLATVSCRSRESVPLPPGSKVKITAVIDSTTIEVAPL